MTSYLFSPSGRFSRLQWWLFGLVQLAGLALAFAAVGGAARIGPPMAIAGALLLLPVAWGGICANIKRFHDRDKSGWWLLISFVPVVGSIWMLVELGLLAGDDGDNRFGPPPGAARRRAALEAEVTAIGNSRLAKIDDDYFARYKAKAAAQASAAAARAALPVAGGGGGKPVFGKRT